MTRPSKWIAALVLVLALATPAGAALCVCGGSKCPVQGVCLPNTATATECALACKAKGQKCEAAKFLKLQGCPKVSK